MTLTPQTFRKTAGIHRAGLAADRPAASDVLVGTLYFATDTGALDRASGAAWDGYGLGRWTDVPFNAANFTASGAMTWTVTAGQVTTNRYTVLGKTLIWSIFISAATLGGTPDQSIRIALPAGFTFPTAVQTMGMINLVGLAWGVALVAYTVGNPLTIYQLDISPMPTGTMYVACQLALEIA